MRRSWIILGNLLFSVLLLPGAAVASEQSVSLYSQGLVEFHAGRMQSAGELMDRAVQADPDDAIALYYRGIIRSRAGDREAGIADLRRALSLRPGFSEAELDLGVALVESGAYAEAEPLLRSASNDPDLRGNARLFLGIAKLRQGKDAESLTDFQEAERVDPALAPTAAYYRGVAYQRMGDQTKARENFDYVIAAKPGSELARQSETFLANLGGAPSQAKRYQIYGSYGLDYDSNVVLRLRGQDLDTLGVETDSDVAMTIGVGGRYSLWRGEQTALSVGYEFFQRIYFQLDEYNLQGHRPNLRFTALWGDFRFGVTAQYEFYLLKTESYLQRVVGDPWIAWHAGDWGRTEVSYRVRWNDFLESPPGGVPVGPVDGDFSDNPDALDSLVHQPRIRQYFYILDPQHYVSISYLYEIRDPSKSVGNAFGLKAHEVQLAGGTPVVGDLELFASYSYRREEYDEGGRVDQPHGIVAILRWPLADWIAVSLGYYGEIHDSNQFAYDRHIASTGFDVWF